jgi:hypothetical protein
MMVPKELQGSRAVPILERLSPFLVSPPFNLELLDTAPFGVAVADEHRIDPLLTSSETFLDILQAMDAITFGPEGMPMARWVFFDGSELPGGIFGLGVPAAEAPDVVKTTLPVPSHYEGIIPLAMFIAVPTPEPGTFFGHNLASTNNVFPSLGLEGLGTVTKALGLKAYQARRQVGATQWDSLALFIHTRFGPLELETAFTPAHGQLNTLTYTCPCTEESLLAALAVPGASLDRPEPDLWVSSEDAETILGLHQEIESGGRLCITGPPRVLKDGEPGERVLEVPVARLG